MTRKQIATGSVLQGGFSIVEVLIAAAIMAGGLLAVASMLPTAATNINYNAATVRATALAQQAIEQRKNQPFATLVGLNTSNIPPALPASEELSVSEGVVGYQSDTFTRRTWVGVSGTAPRREAVVTLMLQWTEPTGTKTVRLDTVIAE